MIDCVVLVTFRICYCVIPMFGCCAWKLALNCVWLGPMIERVGFPFDLGPAYTLGRPWLKITGTTEEGFDYNSSIHSLRFLLGSPSFLFYSGMHVDGPIGVSHTYYVTWVELAHGQSLPAWLLSANHENSPRRKYTWDHF